MANRRTGYGGKALPLLLVAPQLLITFLFFLWPAEQGVWTSFFLDQGFGANRIFVGIENYVAIFTDPLYLESVITTLLFGALVTVFAIGIALVLALAANRVIHAALAYRTALIWPYAVAPALAGVVWYFLLNPSVGVLANWYDAAAPAAKSALESGPLAEVSAWIAGEWNHYTNGGQAMALVVAASVWKQISYNFLFFLAGLQSIPKTLIEAAAMDHAGPWRRFWTITLPLLSPTTFFLVVVNIVYAFFDTFATIHATTSGGPAQATTTLVYSVFRAYESTDYSGSAAQSVVLMALVIGMTMIQFRYVERRVVY